MCLVHLQAWISKSQFYLVYLYQVELLKQLLLSGKKPSLILILIAFDKESERNSTAILTSFGEIVSIPTALFVFIALSSFLIPVAWVG